MPKINSSDERSQSRKLKTSKQILAVSIFLILTFSFSVLFVEYRTPKTGLYNHINSYWMKRSDQIDLAVLLKSEINHTKQRDVIRKTWAKINGNLSLKVMYFFVIGYKNVSESDWNELQEENKKFKDVLTFLSNDDFSRIFWDFIWYYDVGFVKHGFKYLLKCDDSCYVRLKALTRVLKGFETNYLEGNLDKINKSNSIFESVEINNVKNDNYGQLKKDLYWGYFNNFEMISYAFNGGYVLSTQIVGFLANNKNYLRYYHSEDVSVGAWLASVNNIVRIHDRRFDTEYVSRGCQNYYLIRHNVSPDEMMEMYKNLKEKRQLCTKEQRNVKEYLYDWSVAPTKCCNRVL
nr:beta-1,3-galactosyltransferase sqv-2 isoform X3 [Onthophagus taurus]